MASVRAAALTSWDAGEDEEDKAMEVDDPKAEASPKADASACSSAARALQIWDVGGKS